MRDNYQSKRLFFDIFKYGGIKIIAGKFLYNQIDKKLGSLLSLNTISNLFVENQLKFIYSS